MEVNGFKYIEANTGSHLINKYITIAEKIQTMPSPKKKLKKNCTLQQLNGGKPA